MSDLDDLINGMNEDRSRKREEDNKVVFVPKTRIKTLDDVRMDVAAAGGNAMKVTEFDVMLDSLKGAHAERFNHILSSLPDKEFVAAYVSVLPYIKPKFKALEVVKEKPKKRVLEIVTYNSPDEV